MSLWRTLATLLRLRWSPPTDDAANERPMKLVVGLGNPGREYADTRHNIGYAVLDQFAEKYGPVRFRRQFEGRTATIDLGDEKVLLLKPETYMNLSGRSVQPALAFYRMQPTELLVICDDLNLPVGKIRVRRGGSDGGQKGLRSIAQQLGTTEYPRLRVGIGPLPPRRDAADFVLARFKPDEHEPMAEAIQQAIEAVVLWCERGIDECMNQFN